jgi:hypothetical protein
MSQPCFLPLFTGVRGSRILRSSPKVSINVPFGALRDAYGDVLCLLAFYPDTGPGIRRAEVLASK